MKKVLLLTAAMMTMSLAASAQGLVKFQAESPKNMMSATVAPVAAMPCDVQYNTTAAKVSRRTIADGVSYGRPNGTFYISGTSSNKYLYLYIPGIKEVTYKNWATDKANAKWQYGSTTMTDIAGDENNDLTTSWPIISRGYINSAYIPTLSVGDVSYKYGAELEPKSTALINGDSLLEVTNVNRLGGYYYGFSDASIFGTAERNVSIDGVSTPCLRKNVIECFKKPAAPYCLYSVNFPVVSWNSEITTTTTVDGSYFIPDGKQMHLKIIKMTDDGDFTDEVMADIPFTADQMLSDYFQVIKAGLGYGYFEVARTSEDDFGTEVLDPIVIDYPFAIVLDGFEQEGVNFSLYMCDVEGTERDWYELEDGVEGTLCQYVRKDNGELVNGYYYIQTYPASSEYKRQYNGVMYLNGMFDYAELADDAYKNMTAPVEGGAIYTEYVDSESGETVQDPTIQYYTICARLSDWEGIEGQDNYYFEDMPEWLSVTGYNDEYFADYNATIAQITAEPLPAGEKGRYAMIRLVSDKGAKTDVITIIQGEVDLTGIEAIKSNKAAANASSAIYNLAGQRVDANFKGLVIKDGKKVVLK